MFTGSDCGTVRFGTTNVTNVTLFCPVLCDSCLYAGNSSSAEGSNTASTGLPPDEDAATTSMPTIIGGAVAGFAALAALIWFAIRIVKRQQEDANATAAAAAAGAADIVVDNPTFGSPDPSANGRRGSVVVVGSNQQAYIVPTESATDEDDYLAPSRVQARAYEDRQVPGAREHRNHNHNHNNQTYSPPLAPPPTTAATMDYSYIDEDDASEGLRVEIEYATVVDDAPLQQGQQQQVCLDGDGYVEGGALPAGHAAVYAVPVAGGGAGGGGGARLVLDAGGYVAGGELMPSSSLYEEAANSNV